jgi:NADH dehydrogenase
VELAGAIAELSRFVLAKDFRAIDPREAKVTLIEAGPRILPSFSEHLAASAVEQLAEIGAEVKTGARVVAIDEHGVELEGAESADDLPGLGAGRERERIASSTVLWGAGVQANELTRALGVPLDRQGRAIVGDDCALPGRPEVFAIGDMARFEEDGKVLPGVSPVAMQQARYVAKIIRREARARGARPAPGARPADGAKPERAPFSYFDKGSMATIGRSRAIADARGIQMRGFIAWLAWLFIHIWYLIGFKNRLSVVVDWMWAYFGYKRGARLITSTGWRPGLHREDDARRAPPTAPSPPEAARSPESARRRERAASPPA